MSIMPCGNMYSGFEWIANLPPGYLEEVYGDEIPENPPIPIPEETEFSQQEEDEFNRCLAENGYV